MRRAMAKKLDALYRGGHPHRRGDDTHAHADGAQRVCGAEDKATGVIRPAAGAGIRGESRAGGCSSGLRRFRISACQR